MKKRKVWLLAAILSIVFVLSACEGQVSERNVEHASAGTTERALGGIQEDEQKDTVPVFSPADIEQYAEVLETLTKNIGHCSKLFENENMPSLIAVVAWSFENDVDLDEWILDYCDRTDSYISDQEENFRHMCEDLEQYINPKNVA